MINAFETFNISHNAMHVAHDMLDAVRIAHRNGVPGPRRSLFLFAPSHSGKSHTIKSYIYNRIIPQLIADDPSLAEVPKHEIYRSQRKVIHVTLSAEATTMVLQF